MHDSRIEYPWITELRQAPQWQSGAIFWFKVICNYLNLLYMNHEEFLKIKVTEELLDEWFADFLLCKELEGGDEEGEEEQDEE